MKRIFLRTAAGTLTAALLLSMQGCMPMSPQQTAERVAANMAETPCTAASVTGQMELSIGMGGMEVDTTVSVEESLVYSPDPMQGYMNLEMSYELMGIRVPMTLESYLLEEDGKMVQYLHSDDIWMCADADTSMVQAGTAVQFDNPENLTFDKEVEELDDSELELFRDDISEESTKDIVMEREK